MGHDDDVHGDGRGKDSERQILGDGCGLNVVHVESQVVYRMYLLHFQTS